MMLSTVENYSKKLCTTETKIVLQTFYQQSRLKPLSNQWLSLIIIEEHHSLFKVTLLALFTAGGQSKHSCPFASKYLRDARQQKTGGSSITGFMRPDNENSNHGNRFCHRPQTAFQLRSFSCMSLLLYKWQCQPNTTRVVLYQYKRVFLFSQVVDSRFPTAVMYRTSLRLLMGQAKKKYHILIANFNLLHFQGTL